MAINDRVQKNQVFFYITFCPRQIANLALKMKGKYVTALNLSAIVLAPSVKNCSQKT